MRLLFLALLLLSAVGMTVVAARDQPTAPPTLPSSAQANAVPINKSCAVDQENEIDPRVTLLYEGKVIGFCCRDCIRDFQRDPKKYVASLK